MDKPKSYCDYVSMLDKDNLHRVYHDKFYGFLIESDDELFERLVLEINQAGLSWDTILKKQVNFKKAFHNFNIRKVASYNDKDRLRLLNDAGIIRNRLKIDATIHNAKVILNLQREHGSFKSWLDMNHQRRLDEWVKLFKLTFKFTGGEIVNEFLTSSGYLKTPHNKRCPIYKKVLESNKRGLSKIRT